MFLSEKSFNWIRLRWKARYNRRLTGLSLKFSNQLLNRLDWKMVNERLNDSNDNDNEKSSSGNL